jgi:hypothetical protein
MENGKKSPEKSGFGTGFSIFLGSQPTQKLVSEDLQTGATRRVIDGVEMVGVSLGSRPVCDFPTSHLSGKSSLSDYIRSK